MAPAARLAAALALCGGFAVSACGQQAAVEGPVPSTAISPGLSRSSGVDAGSGITWTRVFLEGRLAGSEQAPTPPPTLIAQCTAAGSAGKQKFEVFANFGGVEDRGFYAPWKDTPTDLYPPNHPKVTMTMDFLGYTRVKPVKRQWEAMTTPAGQLRYNTPSTASVNMEDVTFYLRFLLALPTLRLTAPGRGTAEFQTAAWLARIKAEPLCRASGL